MGVTAWFTAEGGRRWGKKGKRKRRKGKEKEEKKKENRKEENKGRKKNRKGIYKIRRISRKIRRRGFADFSGFLGHRRQFRDGGDGEADRPAGPRRARDSRPVADRDVGKARRVCGRGAVPAGIAARASGRERERERESSG
jgi:hypothetical protein